MEWKYYLEDVSKRKLVFAILLVLATYAVLGPLIAAGAYPLMKKSGTEDACKVIHIKDGCCGEFEPINKKYETLYRFLSAPANLIQRSLNTDICKCRWVNRTTELEAGSCRMIENYNPDTEQ